MDSPRLGAVFIRQHHDSKKEIGSYGAFLHVSRLNPGFARAALSVIATQTIRKCPNFSPPIRPLPSYQASIA